MYISLFSIANALLLGFTIYYSIKLLYSHFSYTEIERPYQFVFKLLIFAICINSSYFICEQILNINSLLSESIREIGKNLFNTEISFNNLIQMLNEIQDHYGYVPMDVQQELSECDLDHLGIY